MRAWFDPVFYLHANPDIERAGITLETAWQHYEQYGAAEGRQPVAWFDPAHYLATYPDLAQSSLQGIELFLHFVNYGMAEGRTPALGVRMPIHQLADYAAANPDLRAAFGIDEGALPTLTPTQAQQLTHHYYRWGYTEARSGAPAPFTREGGVVQALTRDVEQLTGTAGNDVFTAVVSPLTANNTLNPGDHIDGGEGRDTLRVLLEGNFAGFAPTGGLRAVEVVSLTSAAGVARTVDTRGMDGVTYYQLLSTGGAAIHLDHVSSGATVALQGQSGGVTRIGMAAEATAGADDTLVMHWHGIGTASTPVALQVSGIEHFIVEASGDSHVDLGGVQGLRSVRLYDGLGPGSLALRASGDALQRIDGSQYGSALHARLADAPLLSTVLGGHGDDVFTVKAGTVSIVAAFQGGAGDNVLAIDGGGGTVAYALADIGTLKLTALDSPLLFAGSQAGALHTVVVGPGVADGVHLAQLGTRDLRLELLGSPSMPADIMLDHAGATVVDVRPGSGETAAHQGGNVILSDSASVRLDVSAQAVYAGTLAAMRAAELTLNLAGKVDHVLGANGIFAPEASHVIIQQGQQDNAATVIAPQAQHLTIGMDASLNLFDSYFTGVRGLEAEVRAGLLTLSELSRLEAAQVTGGGAVEIWGIGDCGCSSTGDVTLSMQGLTGLTIYDISRPSGVVLDVRDHQGLFEVHTINAEQGDVYLTLAGAGPAGTSSGLGLVVAKRVVLDASQFQHELKSMASIVMPPNVPPLPDPDGDGFPVAPADYAPVVLLAEQSAVVHASSHTVGGLPYLWVLGAGEALDVELHDQGSAVIWGVGGAALTSDIRVHGQITTAREIPAPAAPGTSATVEVFADIDTPTRIDVSGLAITMAGVLKIIGSEKDDVIVLGDQQAGTYVTAGEGADVIHVGASPVVLEASGGESGIVSGGALVGIDQVHGFKAGAGGDAVSLTFANQYRALSDVEQSTVAAAGSLKQAADIVAALLAEDVATGFAYGGKTYVLGTDSALGNPFSDTQDALVELVGVSLSSLTPDNFVL